METFDSKVMSFCESSIWQLLTAKTIASYRGYVYLVFTSQVQARSSIVGNSAPSVEAQQALKGMFKALINEDCSIGIDIERY